MIDFFEINHTPLKLSEIKDYRIVEKEMIMRPVFREVAKLFGSKYEFEAMEPYAIILDEKGNGAALTDFKPFELVDAVVKDVFRPVNAVIDTVGDKLNVKTLKYKEYKCKLLSGRVTKLYLLDVPARMISKDGRAYDVYKDTPEHRELGEKTTSAVQLVKTLQITFNTKCEDMLFFGEGVQPINVLDTYNDLKMAVLSYQAYIKQEKEQQRLANQSKGFLGLPHIELPKVSISFGKPKQVTSNDNTIVLSDLKAKLDSGLISKDDYDREIEKHK